MADLFQTYAEQEYARGQASPNTRQHASASEEFSRAPSLTAVLSGDFEHPAIARDKKLKRLCGGVWKAASSQSNPEAAARDLVAKCLLCVDGANEWPPTAPPPLPPPPDVRYALQPPDLQGINGAELTGLKGTVCFMQLCSFLSHKSVHSFSLCCIHNSMYKSANISALLRTSCTRPAPYLMLHSSI